jgi:3-oxoadipate enol-lactonase
MPGYGDSAPLEAMTFAALADAVARLLDHLDLGSAVIVGHSMGGMIAQELALRHADRVRALVLANTSAAFGKPGGDWQREFLRQRLRPLDEGKTPADVAPALVPTMLGDDPDPRALERAVACMASISPAAYRAALHCLVEFDRRADLGAIRCPTLVLAGERDRVAPPEVVERLARAIAGARYELLPGVGHLANLERPDVFDAALGPFLDGLGD